MATANRTEGVVGDHKNSRDPRGNQAELVIDKRLKETETEL